MKTSSLWTILIIGILGFVVVSALMLVGLEGLTSSDKGNQLRTSQLVREHFNHEVTVINLNDGKKPNTYLLDVQYQVHGGAEETDVTLDEMKEVGEYSVQRFKKEIMEGIESIHVTRFEVHGSGCSKRTRKEVRQFENPFKPRKTNPYDWEDGGS